MLFEAIIGHARPVRILKRALANKTLAHAYLFSGEEGVGKKLTALALAAAVNCPVGGDGGCGACPSCRKAAAGGHPDVHVLSSGGEEIKIDQIRQLQGELALKPFEGTKKTLIVDGVESMNTASANAFLKTLEEPPGDCLIVLVTSMPQSLLATIRSRCQEIRFLPLSRQELAGALRQRRGLSEADAWFLAALAQGSMGRALVMDIDQERASREELSALWCGLAQMSPAEVLAQADALSKDRDRLERLLDLGIEWFRDALVLSETGDKDLLVNSEGKHSGDAPRMGMIENIELMVTSRLALERRVSAQLVAEHLLLKLARG
jgi:DNA polymerase-3 subunit delta'